MTSLNELIKRCMVSGFMKESLVVAVIQILHFSDLIHQVSFLKLNT